MREIKRLQKLAGVISETDNQSKGKEFMTGTQLIQDLTQEVKDKISQLQKNFPLHKFKLTSNSRWRSDDPSLEGTYTLSYNGPYDESLEQIINNVGG